MIKDVKGLQRASVQTASIGLVCAFILMLVFKMISIPLGYLYGVVISLLILKQDESNTHLLFHTSKLSSAIFAGLWLLIKMGIYAIGFYLAVKIPIYFNLYAIAVGYLTVKFTIYRLALLRR